MLFASASSTSLPEIDAIEHAHTFDAQEIRKKAVEEVEKRRPPLGQDLELRTRD